MRKIVSLILAVMLVAALVLTASAAGATDLRVSLVDENTPVVGATFEIYLVGQREADGDLILTGSFADYPVDLNAVGEDSSEEASALYGFAKMDGLAPDVTVTTGETGIALAEDLADGIYLIAGLPCEFNGVIYNTEPQLLVLPWMDAITGELDEEPVLQVKFSKEEKETVTRKVLKIWKNDAPHDRPESITVHLLKDGVIYDTVTLDRENRWRHVWTDLDASALWQIVEEVPRPYRVRVQLDGNTFLLTNYGPDRPPEPTPPQEPTQPVPPTTPSDKIPQTGMLWWPALVLGGLGLALVTGGVALRRGSKYDA